jgi:hypothetical protein
MVISVGDVLSLVLAGFVLAAVWVALIPHHSSFVQSRAGPG